MAELNLGVISIPYTNETGPRDPFRARITKKGRVHRLSAKRIQNWMEGKTNDEPDTTVYFPFAWITEAKLFLTDELLKRGADERAARLTESDQSSEEDEE